MHKKNLLSYAAAGKLLISAPLLSASEPATSAISVSGSGKTGDGSSSGSSITALGIYVAFQSDATDLVDGDTNEATDIFVRDTVDNTIERVSISSSGKQGNGDSFSPSISADGRYITFVSSATNLDDSDSGHSADIFVHDRETGNTTRVSQESIEPQDAYFDGSKNPSISAGGQYITYASGVPDLVANDTNAAMDIFVYDRISGFTTRVSTDSSGVQALGHSFHPSISADGRYITFSSFADNLVSDDSNDAQDIFIHDRGKGNTSRVSISSSGKQGNGSSYYPSISADGRYIAYNSEATNLVSNDSNDVTDIFVYDREMGDVSLVSMSSSGKQGNDASFSPSISSNGRYITYYSDATNLVSDDTNGFRDVFAYDRLEGSVSRVNLGESGTETNGASFGRPSISAHGSAISFTSTASNLLSIGDNNEASDVFFRRDTLNTIISNLANTFISSFETTAWPDGWYSFHWNQDSSTYSDGTYSLRANSIGDGETAEAAMVINLEGEGELSFDMKVDSEQDYDFFRLYIDDDLIAEYSGFIDWAQYHYPLSPGLHTLYFEYEKDDSAQSGADTAWVDNVQISSDGSILAEFIERFYANILGRSSDSDGLAYWQEEIQSTSATHVALGFFKSEEFKALALNDREFLNVLYNTIFGRDADQAGLQYWLGEMNNGLLRESVLYGFFQSDEFAALAEQAGVTGYSASDHALFQVKSFVRRLYVNVLGREPDQAGMDYWANGLYNRVASASDIVPGFFFSEEYTKKNHDDKTFVSIAYLTVLNRNADKAGIDYWMEELASGSTRQEMIQGFLYSREFESLASSYGIQAH